MKKVGILTLTNTLNYGGTLQAVALNKTIKKMGMNPVNVICTKPPKAWRSARTYLRERVRLYGCQGIYAKIRICGGIVKTLISNIHYFDVKLKMKKFDMFINDNIITTPYCEDEEKLKKEYSNYDAYIVGSDQVWNTMFFGGDFFAPFFLNFTCSGSPCYSYAASVGGKKEDQYIQEIISRTKHFEKITVREKSLEIQMKHLGSTNVMTVLDPTLLLGKKEWEKFEKKPEKIFPEKYILVYYLEKDSVKDELIKKLSEELNLPVINLMPIYQKTNYPCFVDKTAGPAEFLYYVHHANYIITNSFHMVVFSLIYHKKFIALEREAQESRVIDLLNTVHLNERYIKNIRESGKIMEDYEDVLPLLEAEKKRSLEFLKSIEEK